MVVKISVIIATHNPHLARLRRTLAGLRAQTLPAAEWETVIVDNASNPNIELAPFLADAPSNVRIIREPRLGLTPARLCGFEAAQGEFVVMVDDDNVLAADYLQNAAIHLEIDPSLGAVGGKSVPEFEEVPADWIKPFHGLLALRDLGESPQRADWRNAAKPSYPICAPIGAGMVIRRSLALDYAGVLAGNPQRRALDRAGDQLVSGGDNDLVMHVLAAGSSVGYEPNLVLTHLISAGRLRRSYLGALNRSIARSWVRVLSFHGIQPWRPIPTWTVSLRQWRAWWRARAWQSDAAWVQWQGWCGTFEGQADLGRMDGNQSARQTNPA